MVSVLSSVCCITYPLQFSGIQWAEYRCFFEQLGKAAGGGVADHLGDLAHRKNGIDQQMLRLAHAPPLNVLRDRAAEPALNFVQQDIFVSSETIPIIEEVLL